MLIALSNMFPTLCVLELIIEPFKRTGFVFFCFYGPGPRRTEWGMDRSVVRTDGQVGRADGRTHGSDGQIRRRTDWMRVTDWTDRQIEWTWLASAGCLFTFRDLINLVRLHNKGHTLTDFCCMWPLEGMGVMPTTPSGCRYVPPRQGLSLLFRSLSNPYFHTQLWRVILIRIP